MLRLYLALPWTIEREDAHDDGDYVVLSVRELPGFTVAGRDASEAERRFWPALRQFLQSYIDDGEQPPLPPGSERLMNAVLAAPRVFGITAISPAQRPAAATASLGEVEVVEVA